MSENDDQPQGTWTITVKGDQGWLERLKAEFGDLVEGEMALLAAALRFAAWTPPPDQRIERALAIAQGNARFEGDHHRLWVIDQMARALTGCPMETRTATDVRGKDYSYEVQGENEAYSRIAGEWDWEEGIAP